MKIRNGFVSNSSSSSFCLIGVRGDKLAHKLFRKIVEKVRGCKHIERGSEYCPECGKLMWRTGHIETSNGQYFDERTGLTFIVNSDYATDDRRCEFPKLVTAYNAGFGAEKLLENKSMKDAKVEVLNKLKEFGLDVSEKDITFMYGESHSE